MKNLTNGQNFQIETRSVRLQAAGVNHYCYIFVAGDDTNTVHAKDITAFGLQHATALTAHDNSLGIDEKISSILLADGEHVLIDGVEYETKLAGDYSDCVHFREVGYEARVEASK